MYGIDGWDGRLEESNTANSAAAAAIRTGNQVYIKQTNERTNPKEQLWKSPSGLGGVEEKEFSTNPDYARKREKIRREWNGIVAEEILSYGSIIVHLCSVEITKKI